jgi:signal peptidase II
MSIKNKILGYKVNKKQIIVYFCIILTLVCLDQASKTSIIFYLKTQPGYEKNIFPFLNFVYAWNHGISFGLFSKYYWYSNFLFLALNTIIIIYLVHTLFSQKIIGAQISLLLIISGAIGNLIDRILRGAVFDFLYFYYQAWAFPAFNMADSFISVGACFYIYYYLYGHSLIKKQ